MRFNILFPGTQSYLKKEARNHLEYGISNASWLGITATKAPTIRYTFGLHEPNKPPTSF